MKILLFFLTLFVATALQSSTSAQPLIHSILGQNNFDQLGTDVAGGGDVNGDGFSDFAASAIPMAPGMLPFVQIYSGQTGLPIHTINAPGFYLDFGTQIDLRADVNNDGYADLIVGAPGNYGNGPAAGVFVYSGLTGASLYAWPVVQPYNNFGYAVSTAGDVNGDSFDDILIGIPGCVSPSQPGCVTTFAGSAEVRSGQTGAVLYTFTGSAQGLGAGAQFGGSVSTAGDVNNDGYSDVIIGAYLVDRAYVFSGQNGSLLYTLAGNPGEGLGFAVSDVGDLNHDQYDDFLVSLIGYDNPLFPTYFNSGLVRVYSGQTGQALLSLFGTGNGNTSNNFYGAFGLRATGAGDVNGDGTNDILVRGNELNSGAIFARVYSGLTGEILFSSTDFPFEMDRAGDVNGDGYADIVTGNLGSGNGTVFGGRVAVYGGGSGPFAYTQNLEPHCPIPPFSGAPNLFISTAVVGSNTTISVSGGNQLANVSGWIYVSPPAAFPTDIGQNCFVHLDLNSFSQLMPFTTDFLGNWSSGPLPIPLSLLGSQVSLQAVVPGSGALGLALSSGVKLRFGI